MEYHDFSKNNKHFFSSDCEWQKLLSEFEAAKHFIDNLGFLAFGKDMGIIRSACGFQPVHTNQILQSAAQTLQSMIACAEYGNIADVHVLLRKLRDDLFFYLYVIVACRNNDILSDDDLSKQETYINAWVKNQLSRLNITEVINDITSAGECVELVEKFSLKDELKQIGYTLNNYTHGNGNLYYNRLYTHYKEDEICRVSTELIHMLNYILITFVFLLVLLSPGCIMAPDYLDALDFSMTPEEISRYWVAPFVSEFIEKHKDLLGETALEYLRTVTQMEI